jgi:hypothetical protein
LNTTTSKVVSDFFLSAGFKFEEEDEEEEGGKEE